jgi:hypothetical protein
MKSYENKDIDVDDFLDEGFILIRAIIEIAGSPKEFVEELLEDLKNKLFLFQHPKFPKFENEKEMIEKIKNIFEEEKDLLEGEIENRNAAIVNLQIGEVQPIENTNFYSGFIETEMLVKDLKELLKFSVNFTPSNIQIIEPAKLKVESLVIQDFLNEIVSLLNNLFNNLKNLDAENKLLKEELNKLKRTGLRFKR